MQRCFQVNNLPLFVKSHHAIIDARLQETIVILINYMGDCFRYIIKKRLGNTNLFP